MADDVRPPVEISGRVPADLYDRFTAAFPQHGATTWFIRSVMEKLVAIHEALEVPSLLNEAIEESYKERTSA